MLEDLTGKRFGKITVICRSENNKQYPYWDCICDCGRSLAILHNSLVRGRSKSCGKTGCNSNLKDLTGQRFGRLVVISQADRDSTGRVQWNCVCDCGKKCIIQSRCLTGNNTKSCGCLLRYEDMTLSSKHELLKKYKNSAKKRGHSFELTLEEFNYLIQQNCHYCGSPPHLYHKAWGVIREGGFLYNGIDRVDSSLGYLTENVVPCCKECNYLKWDRTEKGFAQWLSLCHYNLGQGKIPDTGRERIHDTRSFVSDERAVIKKIYPDVYYSISTLYSTYRDICGKRRGLTFMIGIFDFLSLIQQNCFYCGRSPFRRYRKGRSGEILFNGLDRLDCSKGYECENVVPCCTDCNVSKNNLTVPAFLDRIEMCYKHFIGGSKTSLNKITPIKLPALGIWISNRPQKSPVLKSFI